MVLDMGGVILEMGPAGGLPFGQLEVEGRASLLELVAPSGLAQRDLDALLFGPWREGYEQRRVLGREEGFEQHLSRLAAAAGGLDTERLLLAYFAPYGAWLSPLPGAVEAIQRLHAEGYHLAIVSNVPLPGRCYRGVLARLGVASAFSDLRYSHDEGSRKPDPAMLRSTLAAVEIEPLAAIMVGDRKLEDVGSARALGVPAVWLESSFDQGPEPDAVIASLAALPGLLETWGEP